MFCPVVLCMEAVLRHGSWRVADMIQRLRSAGPGCVLVGMFLLPGLAGAVPVDAWPDDASRRADGLLYRLRRTMERAAESPIVKDERGQSYVMDLPGIAYSPRDDNWSPAVPSTSEAPLFLAQARGLLQAGATAPAVEILLALRTMDGRFFRVSEAAKRSAVEATGLLHDLLGRRADGMALVDRMDPFLVYDATAGETWLISEVGGFRAALPGRLRLRRQEGFAGGADHVNRIVQMSDGSHVIAFVMDVWPTSSRRPNAAEVLILNDLRRGLDRGRKEATGFSRTCEDGICSCSLAEKGTPRSWSEMAKTRKGAAFFFSVIPSNGLLLRAIRTSGRDDQRPAEGTEDS